MKEGVIVSNTIILVTFDLLTSLLLITCNMKININTSTYEFWLDHQPLFGKEARSPSPKGHRHERVMSYEYSESYMYLEVGTL